MKKNLKGGKDGNSTNILDTGTEWSVQTPHVLKEETKT